MNSRGPLTLAIVLLLLPVLYVGSYLALVDPRSFKSDPQRAAKERQVVGQPGQPLRHHGGMLSEVVVNYRYFDQTCSVVFWPLEQIDRRVRPEVWGT